MHMPEKFMLNKEREKLEILIDEKINELRKVSVAKDLTLMDAVPY